MEAGHVATTTKKRNIRKGKTKIKIYQQAVIVGVFGAGASAGRAACEAAGGEPQQRRCPDPGELEDHPPY